MTPTSAIVELSALDLMKLVEGAEVRVGVVAIKQGEQSTCSIIGAQQEPERPSEAPETRRRPLPGEGPNVGTRKVITSLRFVRFPTNCGLCSQQVRTGQRAKWCPQTKTVFHEHHEDQECLAVVLA